MPLDPNIITYGLRQMPGVDINAMVQQQITGMENINELERQRQADALALQDRAAKQQADAAQMQEAATMKALLPAYTYGIQTGDIAGAINLVPPDMQESLRPYIDALAGKSPQEVQAALIGSLSSSEVGQEALAAIQRAQTAQIQQGQLDVSREDLALRRQKQALDAEGKGAWELKEGDGGFFWTNSRTREVVPANVTGAVPSAAPGSAPVPAPDVVMPRQPASGASVSTEQTPAEFRPKETKTAAEKGLTEYQGKAVQHATNMAYADKIATDLEKAGVVTPDAVSNAILGVVRSVPLQAGANLANELEYGLNAILPGLTPEEQRLARAQLTFITAVLRSESGAEIKASEFPAEYRKYFAVAGDESNKKLLDEKRTQRRIRIASMREAAGESGRKSIDRILSEAGAYESAAPVATPLAPGAAVDGFVYQGVEE